MESVLPMEVLYTQSLFHLEKLHVNNDRNINSAEKKISILETLMTIHTCVYDKTKTIKFVC